MRALASWILPRLVMLLPALANSAGAPAEPATGVIAQLEDRYPERRVAFAGGVVGLADVTYATPAGVRPLTLDLYLPPARETSAPAIIYVHGGGWMGGHSRQGGAFENWPQVLASFAARGYVVASINYRLSGEAISPAAAQDVASAVRWLRSNAERFSIDKQRVGLWGSSAGGQLAAITATACDAGGLKSTCVQAVAVWYGIFDLAPMVAHPDPQSPPARYLGCGAGKCGEEQISSASAIRHIDRSGPPFLLVHGSRDQTVPPAQSSNFHAALQAQGVKSRLLLIEGVGHSFIGSTPAETHSASLQALRATTEFFDQELQVQRR
jgi:acetyl esterase/lipase